MASDPLSPLDNRPSGPPPRLVTQIAVAHAVKRHPTSGATTVARTRSPRGRRARASVVLLARSLRKNYTGSFFCNAARKRNTEETRVKTARLRAIEWHPLALVANANLSPGDLAATGAEV